jgi:hypothetical protein
VPFFYQLSLVSPWAAGFRVSRFSADLHSVELAFPFAAALAASRL